MANGKKLQTTPPPGTGQPAFLATKVAADAGKGVSTLAEDNIVPLVRVLQALSPQCNKRDPDYVEGAEAGSIWLRNSGLPAISGETGFLFQPCFFSKAVLEWVSRDGGGGLVAQHAERPESAREVDDPKNANRKRWVMPNGNELQETRNHVGYVLLPDGSAHPYVIPFSGTGHTVSRQWMVLLNQKQINGNKAPGFASLYRLTTKERHNAKGTWFVFAVADAGWVTTPEEYERGSALYDSFAKGEKSIEADTADEESTDTAM